MSMETGDASATSEALTAFSPQFVGLHRFRHHSSLQAPHRFSCSQFMAHVFGTKNGANFGRLHTAGRFVMFGSATSIPCLLPLRLVILVLQSSLFVTGIGNDEATKSSRLHFMLLRYLLNIPFCVPRFLMADWFTRGCGPWRWPTSKHFMHCRLLVCFAFSLPPVYNLPLNLCILGRSGPG